MAKEKYFGSLLAIGVGVWFLLDAWDQWDGINSWTGKPYHHTSLGIGDIDYDYSLEASRDLAVKRAILGGMLSLGGLVVLIRRLSR